MSTSRDCSAARATRDVQGVAFLAPDVASPNKTGVIITRVCFVTIEGSFFG